MNIVVVTSRHHLYADIVLRELFRHHGTEVRLVVYEDGIVPGRSRFGGLLKYLRVSGMRYVSAQIIKQLLILLRYRFIAAPTATQVESWEQLKDTGRLISTLESAEPDILISIFSKYRLSETILSIPKLGTLNVHPSLLPSYQGVSPTFWALANDEKITGITIHEMQKEIDEGAIYWQEEVPIIASDSEHGLYVRLARVAARALSEALEQYQDRKPIVLGGEREKSYYSLPTKEGVKNFRRHQRSFFRISEVVQAKQ